MNGRSEKASLQDLVALIEGRPIEEAIFLFKSLTDEKAVLVFEYLSFSVQKEILRSYPPEQIGRLLNKISPDDRTALLEEFPPDLVNQLLKYLTPDERSLSIKLLGYPENSVGRIMTPDYIAIKLEWSVKEVLDHIREKGKDSETFSIIYAVDDKGVLTDDFRIRQLLLSKLDTKMKELADFSFISLRVDDDVESAIQIFKKFGRTALPVIDAKGVMLGIITIDDAMNISIEKDTEEIHLIGAVNALGEPYMHVPFANLMKKRAGWLVILFLGELLTTFAMGFFQDEIAKALVLTLFIPLIISSGGNAGSQASTLIIRALSLGEIKLRDWWKVMNREIYSGLFLGLILGLIGFFRVAIGSLFSTTFGEHALLLALTVFATLIGVVLWGTLMGSMLPLLLKRCGFDPAYSSAPFVATLVDVTGLIIYFTIAFFILQGTLL